MAAPLVDADTSPHLPGALAYFPGGSPGLPHKLPRFPRQSPSPPAALPSLPAALTCFPVVLPSFPGESPRLPRVSPCLPAAPSPLLLGMRGMISYFNRNFFNHTPMTQRKIWRKLPNHPPHPPQAGDPKTGVLTLVSIDREDNPISPLRLHPFARDFLKLDHLAQSRKNAKFFRQAIKAKNPSRQLIGRRIRFIPLARIRFSRFCLWSGSASD